MPQPLITVPLLVVTPTIKLSSLLVSHSSVATIMSSNVSDVCYVNLVNELFLSQGGHGPQVESH